MKKILSIVVILALSLMIIAGCGENKENTAPTISGVKDSISVVSGDEFDALADVTATDEEDGDLTSSIAVESIPTLNFVNGKATPASAGTYEITYSVTDSGNLTTEAYATLTVTKKTAEAVQYWTANFEEKAGESHGWAGEVNEPAQGTASLVEGSYVFDVTNSGTDVNSGAVKLHKVIDVKKADYKVKVWAKSSVKTFAHLIAKNDCVQEWQTYGGSWNFELGTEVKPFEINFSCAGTENSNRAEIIFEMGKIKPNETDISPEAYKIYVVKVEIYEIVGTEHEESLVSYNFNDSIDGVRIDKGNADVNLTHENGCAKVEVTRAGTENWDIKTVFAFGEVQIEAGQKYFYRVKLNSEKTQNGEICVESDATEWQNRAKFDGLALEAGEKTLYQEFVSEVNITDPVLKMYIGKNDTGSNTITIDEFTFGKLEGDKETKKTTDRFIAYGKDSQNYTNPNYIFETFNGTDEDNEFGVGTIWTTSGKMFYRIDQASTTDWHNKLVFGYNDNPLVLPADSYFTLRIKVKANKNVSCALFLNVLGNWAPRLTQTLDITTEEQEFEFSTTETLVTPMNFELLFQFGSQSTKDLGDVTIEISEVTILQKVVS